jgi:hypothetical protein
VTLETSVVNISSVGVVGGLKVELEIVGCWDLVEIVRTTTGFSNTVEVSSSFGVEVVET